MIRNYCQNAVRGVRVPLVMLGFMLCVCTPGWSLQLYQDEDVFGDSVVKAKADKKEEPKDTNPFVAPGEEDPNAPLADDPKKKRLPRVTDHGEVIFQRVQDKDPTTMTEKEFYQTLTAAEKLILTRTPESGPELYEAGAMIARLGRPEFAALLLKKSLAAKGTPIQYAAVLDRLGTNRVQFLIANPVVGPDGTEATLKAMAEAEKYWKDPATIEGAFKQAMSPNPEIQAQGMLEVLKGGSAAVAILFAKLKSGNEKETETAKAFLRFLGTTSVDPILVSLDTTDEKLQTTLVESLSRVKSPKVPDILLAKYYDDSTPAAMRDGVLKRAVIAHFGKIPTAGEAYERLFSRLMEYYRRVTPFRGSDGGFDGKSSEWVWNESKQLPEQKEFVIDQYYRAKTLEWAKRLVPLAKKQAADKYFEFRRVYMAVLSEWSIYETGLDKPVDLAEFRKTFPEAGSGELLAALTFAISSGHDKAGIIPVFLLGMTNDKSLCYGDKQPSSLIQATRSRDRRLRYYAAATVVRLNPDRPYIGSSYVTETLMQFACSKGEKVAIVGDPHIDNAMRLGSFLTGHGYRIIPATTGGDIIAKAQNNPDVDMVLATEQIRRPEVFTVVQTLENDYRTSDVAIAIGLTEGPETTDSHEYATVRTHGVEVPMPFDVTSGEYVLRILTDATRLEPVPAKTRLEYAKTSAALLQKLVAAHSDVYHVPDFEPFVRRLLETPVMFGAGLELAKLVPTRSMQNHLVCLIGDERYTLKARRAILTTLEAHFQTNGSLLRGPDIARMYERYNASEKEGQETQNILSAMLDSYEKTKGPRQ